MKSLYASSNSVTEFGGGARRRQGGGGDEEDLFHIQYFTNRGQCPIHRVFVDHKRRRKPDHILVRLLCKHSLFLQGFTEPARAFCLGFQFHSDQQTFPPHFFHVRAWDLG